MKRACRSGRDQSLLILCSGAVYYLLYFRNASTYVELLWDFVLPGGPGKSVPTQVLELPFRLNPNLIEQILARFSREIMSLIWYTPLFTSVPKAITAAFQRQTISS